MDRIRTKISVSISEEPLDTDAAHSFLKDELCGANIVFVGTTRAQTGAETTAWLEYEADCKMAESQMAKIAERAAESFRIRAVYMAHRIGRVLPAEASVIVGVAGEHRMDTYLASEYLINVLKSEVPIWKKNVDASNNEDWVD